MMVRSWLGYLFLLLLVEKSLQAKIKKSFQAKKLMSPLRKASVRVGTRRKSRQ